MRSADFERVRISLQATSERLTFRVSRGQSPGTRIPQSDLTPRQAMSLMRSLQAYQRRYRWPIPMIPALERLSRQDD
jgi:hypothetical protein